MTRYTRAWYNRRWHVKNLSFIYYLVRRKNFSSFVAVLVCRTGIITFFIIITRCNATEVATGVAWASSFENSTLYHHTGPNRPIKSLLYYLHTHPENISHRYSTTRRRCARFLVGQMRIIMRMIRIPRSWRLRDFLDSF